ncbi:PKD2L1 [Symbiodinium sp. CCMP2592]|nr:PKD2L1 [Symbiodinium sp. CCMP2592]
MPPMSAMSAATTVVVLGNERARRRARPSTAHATGHKKDPSDIFMQFQTMKFRMDILHERLEVEDGLIGLLQSLPLFLLCLICFLLAISTLAPPAETSAIHQHLESHFSLDTVYSVTDLTGIYSFLETFESKNQELRPTSSSFWCESRYYSYSWDDHYFVPTASCQSPRFTALSLQDSPEWTNTSDAGADAQRRLATNSSEETSAAEPSATHPNPACEDNDAAYQTEENNPNVTCHSDALHACRTDLGIVFCAKTCGYCSPFTYEPLKRFDKPQLTMLPSVVYQSRLATTDCRGFASWFQTQNYNPVLSLMPALDGQKNGTLFTCVDRLKKYEEDYAFYLECPTNMPPARCADGRVGLTAKQSFHGTSVYPTMLIESARDLEAMQKVGWIDVQTEKVAISTMIYTENIEMFTSLTVEFAFDYAGNIAGSVQMISYRDLVHSASDSFFALLLTTCIAASLSVVSLTVYLIRHPETCNWGLVIFEIFSRALFLIYPSILLVTWTQQAYMSHEFESLLQTFLNSHGLNEEHLTKSLAKYFEGKTEVYEEVEWLETHRLASYIMLYVQFLQAVLYFSAHPQVAMLTRTVKKALWNMVHFFVVFAILFLMLAFMAHFLLGGTVHLFGTFPDACATQVRMLFGEFIFVDGAEKLSGSMSVMYWVYAASFMLVVIPESPPFTALLGSVFLYNTPHMWRMYLMSKAAGGVDKIKNENPRGQKEEMTKHPVYGEAIVRAEAAHQNGLESFPVFAAGILGATLMGVDKATVGKLASFHLVCRTAFNAIIVDAFVDVKSECDDLQCTRNVFADFCSIPRSWHLHRKYRLPARHSLCHFLDEALDAFEEERERERRRLSKVFSAHTTGNLWVMV